MVAHLKGWVVSTCFSWWNARCCCHPIVSWVGLGWVSAQRRNAIYFRASWLIIVRFGVHRRPPGFSPDGTHVVIAVVSCCFARYSSFVLVGVVGVIAAVVVVIVGNAPRYCRSGWAHRWMFRVRLFW